LGRSIAIVFVSENLYIVIVANLIDCFFNGRFGQLEQSSWQQPERPFEFSSLKFLRFSFDPTFSGMSEPTFTRPKAPPSLKLRKGTARVKMALRVGGGTRAPALSLSKGYL